MWSYSSEEGEAETPPRRLTAMLEDGTLAVAYDEGSTIYPKQPVDCADICRAFNLPDIIDEPPAEIAQPALKNITVPAPKSFLPKQDCELFRLRQSGMEWAEVCNYFAGRTSRDCRERYIACLVEFVVAAYEQRVKARSAAQEAAPQKKERWTVPGEDLMWELYKTGKDNYEAMTRLLPGRTAAVCASRWAAVCWRREMQGGLNAGGVGGEAAGPSQPIDYFLDVDQVDDPVESDDEILDEFLEPDPFAVHLPVSWTPDQDRELYHLRQTGLDWCDVPTHFSGTTDKDCRERYIVCLVRDIRVVNDERAQRDKVANYPRASTRWSRPEEDLLSELRSDGLGWRSIEKMLPGRTFQACECHWKNMRKSRILQEGAATAGAAVEGAGPSSL